VKSIVGEGQCSGGENLVKLALIDHRRTINVLTQEVEKLKFFHKDTVDRLQLELLQAKAVGTNVSQIRVRGDNDTTIVVEDAVNRMLHHTPLVSGGFESPTMALLRHVVIKAAG